MVFGSTLLFSDFCRRDSNFIFHKATNFTIEKFIFYTRYCRKWIESGYGQDYLHKYHISRQSPILKEIAEGGFESFNPFTAEEIQKYIQTDIKIENELLGEHHEEDNDDIIPKKKTKPSIFDASSDERPYLGKKFQILYKDSDQKKK